MQGVPRYVRVNSLVTHPECMQVPEFIASVSTGKLHDELLIG